MAAYLTGGRLVWPEAQKNIYVGKFNTPVALPHQLHSPKHRLQGCEYYRSVSRHTSHSNVSTNIVTFASEPLRELVNTLTAFLCL